MIHLNDERSNAARFAVNGSGDLVTHAIDYGNEAELFDYGTAGELNSNNKRRFGRRPLGYRRFARAADAIRFAIEEMPPQLLVNACLEVDEVRFDGAGIRRLYESDAYPNVRVVAAAQP
jgi:hypothetical protein